jgi:hypothetical protein
MVKEYPAMVLAETSGSTNSIRPVAGRART